MINSVEERTLGGNFRYFIDDSFNFGITLYESTYDRVLDPQILETVVGGDGDLDDDGFVFIVDRLKDMVIVSGFNVFPREIDEILIGHPKVQEAATLGITDDYRGEIIKAFITLHKGENVKENELIKYCAEKLVKYKIPSVFEFTTNLPKTPVGKIDKRRLKQKL